MGCVLATKHGLLPGKLTCPMKINGWKVYFLLKVRPFLGDILVFGRGKLFRCPDLLFSATYGASPTVGFSQ